MTLRRSLLVSLLVLLPAGAGAQQTAAAAPVTIKRSVPPLSWTGCPAMRPPTPQEDEAKLAEAEELAESATEAAILGNNMAALDLLTTAAGLDPTSERLAYRRARALEELGKTDQALAGYCLYLALRPTGGDAAEVRQRIAAMVQTSGFSISSAAAQAYRSGLAHFDARRLAQADSAFSAAAAAAPAWSDPIYNRAVVRLALGRTPAAHADFRRYLEMSPGSPDLGPILEIIGTSAATTRPPYNPATALATGLLVPGLGQLTTGRTTKGLLIMGAATAAVAAGLVAERVKVECLSVPVDGQCPPDQVQDERKEHPYLVPALAAAAAIGIYGAIDTYLFARRRNAEAAAGLRIGSANGGRGFSLHAPALGAGMQGPTLALVRVSF